MRTLFLSFFLALTVSAFAQISSENLCQKIGYAQTDYIIGQLPEFKKAELEIRTHRAQLENLLKSKYEEFQEKLKAYQTLPPRTADAIKTDKERELAALKDGIEKFRQDAENSYQEKSTALLDPIYKKIGTTIENIAKEGGYDFIVNPQHHLVK